MKKKILTINIILTILLGIVLPFTSVKAATGTVTLKASKESVAPGEEFTVTLFATHSDYINGLVADLKYDSELLELKDTQSTDSSKWENASISSDKIEVMWKGTEDKSSQNYQPTVKSADIIVFTFKAKENAKEESKATVTIENILVSGGGLEDDVNIAVASQTIKIEETRKLGDVDGNGTVDFKDILAVNKHRLGGEQLEGKDFLAGDIDKNGELNFKDILQINKIRLWKA